MKVLILHMRYAPDATGTAPLVTQLAEDLTRLGSKVSVVTSLPHYGRKKVHPDFDNIQGLFHFRYENGVDIFRTKIYVPPTTGMLARGINYLSFNINSILAGIRVKSVDIVLAINPPITNSFAAWILSVIHRVPLVIGIQDVWPDCIVLVGKIRNPLVITLSKILERVQYAISNKIIVLSEGMARNLEGKGVIRSKIAVIPNWADTDEIIPQSRENSFSKVHNLSNKFVVLFAGNHGYISALDTVIEAALLTKHDPEILYLLAGEGSVKESLVSLVREKGLNNVLFLPTQPKKDWLEMLSVADIGLVTLKKELADLNVPSKLYTLMAAERPILASVPAQSEIINLVSDAKCGFWVKPESPLDLANVILENKGKRELLSEMGKRGRTYLIKHQNKDLRTEQYRDLLKQVILKDTKL